jgi:hypothetical protein
VELTYKICVEQKNKKSGSLAEIQAAKGNTEEENDGYEV